MRIPNNLAFVLRLQLPPSATLNNALTSDGSIATAEIQDNQVVVHPNPNVTGIFTVTLFGADIEGNDIFGVFMLHSTTENFTDTFAILLPVVL